jgi:hypothetical protein
VSGAIGWGAEVLERGVFGGTDDEIGVSTGDVFVLWVVWRLAAANEQIQAHERRLHRHEDKASGAKLVVFVLCPISFAQGQAREERDNEHQTILTV